MPIIRSKHQSDETIEEFYSEIDIAIAYIEAGKEMLKLIEFINQNFTQTELFVFTSHHTMCLLPKNTKRFDDIIHITAHPFSEKYSFSYKLPAEKSPWKDAWISGTAQGIEEGLIFLIKSMIGTEKWKSNKELKSLAKKYNVYDKD